MTWVYLHDVARRANDVQIAALYPSRGHRSGWARTGETTAVPTIVQAEIHLIDPPVVVFLVVVTTGDGRPRVREFHVTPSRSQDSVTTTMLRKLPIDQLVRATMERSTLAIEPRPDIHDGAFQVPGDPDHQAWVGPLPAAVGRGRAVPSDRVRKAAEVYRQAIADGSKAPTEAVAKTMGYSRPTAARDVRAARERGLLPATSGMVDDPEGPSSASDVGEQAGRSAAESGAGKPLWRSFDTPEKWEPLDEWVANSAKYFRHPGAPNPDPSDPRNRIFPDVDEGPTDESTANGE
jgi:hypothetical protein